MFFYTNRHLANLDYFCMATEADMEGITHSDVALLDNRALCDNSFLHLYVYRRNRYTHLQHITMRFLLMVALLGIHSLVSAAPATQLPDGMPSPIAAQLKETELKARVILSNGPPPIEISKDGILTLKWMAFNELLEVAFFSELLANVTNNVPGFEVRNENDRNLTVRSLTAILEVRFVSYEEMRINSHIQQEEHHAFGANNALQQANLRPIKPCKYTFPVSTYKDAINLAMTLTDLPLGTLQDAIQRFATGSDIGLVRVFASIIGQKGKQAGWYRVQQGKIASETPSPTTNDLSFAFSVARMFTVRNSCPSVRSIRLNTYYPLTILTPPVNRTQNILVGWKPNPAIKEPEMLWMTYINQLNVPVVVPLRAVALNEMAIAKASFPYTENLMKGLTMAAVTVDKGPFLNAGAVAEKTVSGPGLIVVD
jgi:hypothetical protein